MTVNPCSTCGGTGKIPCDEPAHPGWCEPRCPRCEGMPKLACGFCDEGHFGCGGRGWFFPDPDTVMWWCFEHDCDIMPSAYKPPDVCWLADSAGVFNQCSPAWVPRPDKRLEVVE